MNSFKKALTIAALLCVPCTANAASTIVVPNLDYKSEVRTFFFYESASSQAQVNDSAHLNASDTHFSAAGTYSGEASSSYLKTFHDDIHVQYGQLRGMAGDIRGQLIKNGFIVINAGTHSQKPKQEDDFFDLNKRIKAGEFGKADYVLYGIVTSVDPQVGAEPLAGTNTQMNVYALNMAVEFNLVDTKTLKTVSAFTVSASANDSKIGNGSVPPNKSKIVADLSKNLAAETAKQLAEQGVISTSINQATLPGDADVIPSSPENPITVYRPD